MSLNVDPVGYRPLIARSTSGCAVLLVVEPLERRGLQRLGEDVRVEAGVGAHGQDLAVARVHRHEGAAAVLDAVGDRDSAGLGHGVLAGALEVEVERELELLALDRLALGERPLGPPEGVDLDAGRPGLAAQVAVVGVLQAALPHDGALRHAAEARLLELARADLAHGAEDLRRQLIVGIGAQEHRLHVHARELVLALQDVVAHGGADVLLERDVGVGQQLLLLGDLADHLRLPHAQDGPQPGQQLVAPGAGRRDLVGPQLHGDRDPVVHEDAAVAVEHVAARRRHDDVADLVVRRLRQVLVARQHLQVPQAEEDDGEHRQRHAREHGHPPRKLRRDRGPAVLLKLEHEGEGPRRARSGTARR